MKITLLVFALLLSCSVDGLRILSVLPTVVKSHYAPTRRIILELASRGHEVVSISPYEEKNVTGSFTWVPVEISSMFDALPTLKDDVHVKLNFFSAQNRLWRFTNTYVKYIINLPKLKHFIENDNSHFDLILTEEFYMPYFHVFSYKYKAPLAIIGSFGPGHFMSEYLGNSLEFSYVPHEFLNLFGDMTFFQRIKNLFCCLYDIIVRQYYLFPEQDALVKESFKSLGDIPNLYDIERNASLLLINSHFSLTVVRPYLPNIIEVGGVHLEAVKSLSKEFHDILDGATDGAILFSFGSVMELASQPKETIINVLNSLGKLKQRILLKWNSNESVPVSHNNIYPFSWLPQNDILVHPNIRLFVTHGGLLSSIEAIYHGVPIICIPFYGDQPLNCERGARMGYGITLDKESLNTIELERSIRRVLANPSYQNMARELAYRFRDRPNSALDTAIYWLEYCARHKGMHYAKSPKRNLYWFQYCFVDVFAFILMILWVAKIVLKFILSSLLYSKKVKTN